MPKFDRAFSAVRRSPVAWVWKSAMALVVLTVLVYIAVKSDGGRVIGVWDATLFGIGFSVLFPAVLIGCFLLPEERFLMVNSKLLPSVLAAFAPLLIGLYYLKTAVREGAAEHYDAMNAASTIWWRYFKIGYALLVLWFLILVCFSVHGWWRFFRSRRREAVAQ